MVMTWLAVLIFGACVLYLMIEVKDWIDHE